MKATNTNLDAPALGGRRFLPIARLVPILGYADVANLRKALDRGAVPYVKMNGRRRLYDEAQVIAWLDRRTVGRKIEPEAAA